MLLALNLTAISAGYGTTPRKTRLQCSSVRYIGLALEATTNEDLATIVNISKERVSIGQLL